MSISLRLLSFPCKGKCSSLGHTLQNLFKLAKRFNAIASCGCALTMRVIEIDTSVDMVVAVRPATVRFSTLASCTVSGAVVFQR